MEKCLLMPWQDALKREKVKHRLFLMIGLLLVGMVALLLAVKLNFPVMDWSLLLLLQLPALIGFVTLVILTSWLEIRSSRNRSYIETIQHGGEFYWLR
jgi:hypothetical protein